MNLRQGGIAAGGCVCLFPPRKKLAGGCGGKKLCRRGQYGNILGFSSAWLGCMGGVRKRSFHGAGRPAASQGPSPPPPSWQTPCLPLGPRVRVPPAPQHCHPLSPPRCKAEHWDGRRSPAARGTCRHLGVGTPAQDGEGEVSCTAPPPLRGAREVSEQQNKGLTSASECHCVRYRCGPAAGMPWGPPGRALAKCEGSLGAAGDDDTCLHPCGGCQTRWLWWLEVLWLVSQLEKSPTSEVSHPS